MNAKNNSNSDLNKSVSVKKSRFTEMLIEENELDQNGFENWIFCNGMLFNSPDKWWGDHGLRDYPHEGVDLCLYSDSSRHICCIDEKTRIPVMQRGMIKAMFKDYLGQAIAIEHESVVVLSMKFQEHLQNLPLRTGICMRIQKHQLWKVSAIQLK